LRHENVFRISRPSRHDVDPILRRSKQSQACMAAHKPSFKPPPTLLSKLGYRNLDAKARHPKPLPINAFSAPRTIQLFFILEQSALASRSIKHR